ncbi:MAG: FMN-binding protein [Acidobacteria bacterium]|nr:FMN-binding protein [Acidobacteriota bacterium]
MRFRFFQALLLALLAHGDVSGAEFATREEVLALVYQGASIKSETVFLTAEQKKRAEEIAAVSIPSPLIARYIASRSGKEVGRAYLDTHIVRTKKESLLICLGADGEVRRIEVTAFLEPPDYRATPAWYRQYEGKALTPDLRLERQIRPVAGATLTAVAATQAVRRVLAIDRILKAGKGDVR